MKTRTFLPIVAVLFAAASLPASAQLPTLLAPRKSALNTVEIILDGVANLQTIANAYTVPIGKRLVITDLIISNGNPNQVRFQRIFRNNDPVTPNITVPAESTFGHSFASGLQFKAGEILKIKNGDAAGATNFALYGYLVPTKTP
ncbi:MAG: hypothetical protein ACKOFH_14880 [Chthoniobacterales bacterium]